MDVFFYEAFEEERQALQRHCPAHIQAGYEVSTIQEASHASPPARVISIRTQSIIPPSWASQIDAILTRSAGYDHVTRYRQQPGAEAVAAGYLPLYCARAVAEQAMVLWMALLRRIPKQIKHFDTFARDGLTGRECQGRTLVVVGVGHIGHAICKLGSSLEMRVIGVDLAPRHPDVSYQPFEAAVGQADVIVAAMNLTAQNRGYFNRASLGAAKPGCVFVNIARGELCVTSDLPHLLDTGILSGVALDVFDDEPELAVRLRGQGFAGAKGSGKNDVNLHDIMALRKREDVILTPHNAFNTVEAVERKAAQSFEQVGHFLHHRRFLWPVPSRG